MRAASQGGGAAARAVPAGGEQGGAWEAVFLPAGTAVSLVGLQPEARPEYARLDDGLPMGRAGPLLATAQWPEPARPSVERVRRIFLERDARTALFFLPRDRAHGRWWYRSGGEWRWNDRSRW